MSKFAELIMAHKKSDPYNVGLKFSCKHIQVDSKMVILGFAVEITKQ